MAQQLAEAAGPRQADVISQPFGFLAETRGEGPMDNEAGIGCFPLNPVQGALLLGQQWDLLSRDLHATLACGRRELPGSSLWLDGQHSPHVQTARLKSTGPFAL